MLARLNQQLMEEGHCNAMHRSELETRMRSMRDVNYAATLFEIGEHIIAYALWHDEPEWVYLRQYLAAKGFRRRGIGAQAVRVLTDEVHPGDKRVTVYALTGNRPRLEF